MEASERKQLEDSVHSAAIDLDFDSRKLLVGDDSWEITEFDAKVYMSLQNLERDTETLKRMHNLLLKIKALETSDNPDREAEVKKLGEEFYSL